MSHDPTAEQQAFPWGMLATGGVLAVFAADALTPPGFAHGTLYLPLVVLMAFSRRQPLVVGICVASIAATVAGIWISPAGAGGVGIPSGLVVGNALVSVLALLAVGSLTVLLLRQQQRSGELATRLETTLESVTDAFILLDPEWRVRFVNAEGERQTGQTREVLVGRDIWEAFPEAKGSRFEREYRDAVASGRPARFEEFYPPLGKTFEVNAYPSREGLAVYFRDVSEQRALAQQVRQSQHMESLGQLTGGIAHDFNNLLTVIQGNAELLAEQVQNQSRLAELVSMIEAASLRGAELTRQLLAFARKQPLAPRALDLGQRIEDLAPLLRRSLGEDIDIAFERADGLWPVELDPGQLETALFNLCVNARDAMPTGGTLTIVTENVRVESMSADPNAPGPGEYVVLAVADTGSGISEQDLPRVFEPFFTTKPRGKGTGLGLSMVYGFVMQSGGHVHIDSSPGQGTTVRLYFPRFGEAAAAAAAADVALPAATPGGETLLVVEDDALVREFARTRLATLGYRVLEAASGQAALDVLRAHPEVDLLFTDVVMPGGMNGRQLADAARAARPGLKVLFTSGYAEDAIVHDGRLDSGVQLLSKPYRLAELATRVRSALDATS